MTSRTRLVGTGIGGDGSIAVADKSSDNTAICFYAVKDGDHIDGMWT